MGKGGSSVQQRPRAVITLGPPPNVREREEYIMKQQRWLLFMRHCAKCQQDEEECPFKRSCRVGKGLWEHILGCADSRCQYPRCVSTKDLLKHHQKCNNTACPICPPVKEYVRHCRTGTTTSAGGVQDGGP